MTPLRVFAAAFALLTVLLCSRALALQHPLLLKQRHARLVQERSLVAPGFKYTGPPACFKTKPVCSPQGAAPNVPKCVSGPGGPINGVWQCPAVNCKAGYTPQWLPISSTAYGVRCQPPASTCTNGQVVTYLTVNLASKPIYGYVCACSTPGQIFDGVKCTACANNAYVSGSWKNNQVCKCAAGNPAADYTSNNSNDHGREDFPSGFSCVTDKAGVAKQRPQGHNQAPRYYGPCYCYQAPTYSFSWTQSWTDFGDAMEDPEFWFEVSDAVLA